MTIGWRIKQNASVVDHHINSDEQVLYAFIGQKNNNPFNTRYLRVLLLRIREF